MYLGEFDINTAQQYYKFDIMLSMGGSIAEAMFGCDSVDTDVALDYGWLHSMRDECENGGDSAFQGDYTKILSSAERVYPEAPQLAEKAICTAARWTNEIFSNPQMRTLVGNLAEDMLNQQKTYFSGDFVWHRMSVEWGHQSLPILQRRWKRRFARFLKTEEITQFRCLAMSLFDK